MSRTGECILHAKMPTHPDHKEALPISGYAVVSGVEEPDTNVVPVADVPKDRKLSLQK